MMPSRQTPGPSSLTSGHPLNTTPSPWEIGGTLHRRTGCLATASAIKESRGKPHDEGTRPMRRHLSVVLVALLIVACVGETGPTGPQGSRGTAGLDGQDGRPGPAGPAGEPLNWADVLEVHRVNEATYVLLYSYTHRDGKRYYYMFCTGFAAYYTSVVWTNAHCVDAALERSRELRGADPHFFIVRAETPIGGDQTYAIDWSEPLKVDTDGAMD